MRAQRGFTLVELTIVVAIIAILAMIALPTFTQTLAHAQAATTKGNLGVLRVAINAYTGAKEGLAPSTLEDLIPTYLKRIPSTYTPGIHAPNNITYFRASLNMYGSDPCVNMLPESSMSDRGGGWMYRFPNDTAWIVNGAPIGYCSPGSVIVDCKHRDERGVVWADY